MPHFDRSASAARRVAGALSAVLAVAGTAAVVACSDTPAGTTSGKGTTEVLLTDAPFPYDSIAHVSIFVERIEASPSSDTTPANHDWVTVASPNAAFDLLALQNGRTASLGEGAIPTGRYHAIRMVLNTDRSSVVNKDGATVPVTWGSSAGEPTLYALVESPIDVAGGGSVVIDFDVGRSFLCPGTSCTGELVFSPVFRAVDFDATGSIAGTVRGDTLTESGPALGAATITVFAGDLRRLESSLPVVATGRTDDQGRYTIAFLTPGSYVVRADPPRASGFTAAVLGSVVVAAKQTTQAPEIRLPVAGSGGGVDTTGGGPDTTGGGGGGGGGSGGATGTVATVDVSPTSASLAVGDSVVFVATGRDSSGTELSGEALAWTVSDSAVVIPIGMGTRYLAIRAVGRGSATVSAIARSGQRGTATVTVR
ncbi:MAG TPA: DUF4382 domain-containing protein [Gemmatimonadaceae bacterium]|nr:DUF4382 domain-containing protein [Gemmatimonadaceae bacterium]